MVHICDKPDMMHFLKLSQSYIKIVDIGKFEYCFVIEKKSGVNWWTDSTVVSIAV